MSDQTIREGDRVVVVYPYPCCGAADDVGKIFTVLSLSGGLSICTLCGQSNIGIDTQWKQGNNWKDVRRLQKLNGPTTKQSTETERETEAT